MKKIVTIILVIALLSLTACGESAQAYEAGVTDSSSYTSSFFGLRYELQEGWTFATREEIAVIMGGAADMVGEDYAALIDETGSITEFYVTSASGTDTLNMSVENMSIVYATVLTEEAYLEASTDGLVGALESMGVGNITTNISTMSFAGEDHACLELSGEYMGIAIYEKMVVIKNGSYMGVICACTWIENTTDSILAQFSAA